MVADEIWMPMTNHWSPCCTYSSVILSCSPRFSDYDTPFALALVDTADTLSFARASLMPWSLLIVCCVIRPIIHLAFNTALVSSATIDLMANGCEVLASLELASGSINHIYHSRCINKMRLNTTASVHIWAQLIVIIRLLESCLIFTILDVMVQILVNYHRLIRSVVQLLLIRRYGPITRAKVHHSPVPLRRQLLTVSTVLPGVCQGRYRTVVRIQKDEFWIVGHCQACRQLLNIVVKLFKNVAGALLRDLQDQTLRLLHIERRYEHSRMARTDLYNVIAFAHSFALFVEDYSVFVEDAGLPIDNGVRLGEFAASGTWTTQ